MTKPPILDMTTQGEFREAPRPPRLPVSARILRVAIIVAVLTAMVAFAALALWLALILIPVALAAAAIGWLAWRYRVWRVTGR